MIKILFFGALREKIGYANLSLPWTPDTSCNVTEVLHQLSLQSDAIKNALFDGQLLCAVNQQICSLQHIVQCGDEVAFFPPVTGG